MVRTTARRKMMFGFAATAALVLLSSAAFACTVFRGMMTLEAVASVPAGHHNGQISTAHGNGLGMSHCSDPRLTTEGGTQSAVAGGDGILPVGDNEPPTGEATTFSIVINTAPSTICTTGNNQKLSAGNYIVSWARAFSTDCMAQALGTPEYVDPKPFTVDGNGNGVGSVANRTYTFSAVANGVHPGTGPARYSGVCLTSTTQAGVLQGNRAPLRVV